MKLLLFIIFTLFTFKDLYSQKSKVSVENESLDEMAMELNLSFFEKNVYPFANEHSYSYYQRDANYTTKKYDYYNMCMKFIRQYPKNSKGYVFRGWYYTIIKDYALAMNDFNKSIQLFPNEFEGYYRRAILKEIQDDFRGGLQDVNKLIGVLPKSSFDEFRYDEYYKLSGFTKYHLKDYQGAITAFTKAIEYNIKENQKLFNKGATEELNILFKYRIIARKELSILLSDKINAQDEANAIINDCTELIKIASKSSDEVSKKIEASAYSTRGLKKIEIKQKESGCLDLSKAGELGDTSVYFVIRANCN